MRDDFRERREEKGREIKGIYMALLLHVARGEKGDTSAGG